jgi:PAS domain S-box-containing protein
MTGSEMLSRGKALLSRGKALLPRGIRLDSFNSALVGVAVTSGSDHRLIYMNYAYRKIVGGPRLGLPIREALRDLRPEEYFALLDRVLETGEAVSLEGLPFACDERDPSGHERFASVNLSKLSLRNGKEGVLTVTVEVTHWVDSAQAMGAIADSRRRFLQRYQSLVQLVWVTDPRGGISEPNPGWQQYTGQSWEEFRGDGWVTAVHPDDRGPAMETWLRAVKRQSRLDQVYRLKGPDGTYRHVRLRGVPIIEDGEIVEWVGTMADVEQEWQQERRRKLLDEAAAATADLADLDEVLRALSEVIVPAVADGCGIYLLPEMEDESLKSPFFAKRVASTMRGGLLRRLPLRAERFEPDSDFAAVIRTRKPIRIAFPSGAPPPGVVPSGAEEWFASARANSTALVPVLVDGVVAAVVSATTVAGGSEPLSAADIDLLERMLDHAHAHLSNAMRFQRTQRVALALQNYLLADPPEVPGLEITARYQACATAVEIGGDWYDSFVSPDGSTVLSIGDVAGHDLAAAVTMSQLRNMLRGLAMDRKEPPGDTLRRLNMATELLYREGTATCILARLEYGGAWRLTYSVAGHPPPLLVTHEGEARYLEDGANLMLGVGYDMPRTSAVAALPPRSTLLLYTDGLVEVPGEHLDTGLERLRRTAASLAREPLDTFCDKLLRMPMVCKDDIAMIAVRLPGS